MTTRQQVARLQCFHRDTLPANSLNTYERGVLDGHLCCQDKVDSTIDAMGRLASRIAVLEAACEEAERALVEEGHVPSGREGCPLCGAVDTLRRAREGKP